MPFNSRPGPAAAACLFVASLAYGHTITVDGFASDWSARTTPFDNMGIIARAANGTGEYIFVDAAGDFRPDLGASLEQDIRRFQVTADADSISFLIHTAGHDPSIVPQVQIALDLDRIAGSGQNSFAGFADTLVPNNARWEYLVQTRFFDQFGPDAQVLNTAFQVVATNVSAVRGPGGDIEIDVPWVDLGLTGPPATPIRISMAMFQSLNDADDTVDIGGVLTSNAVDTIGDCGDPRQSGFPGSLNCDLSDRTIDFHADVYFAPNGDVYSPLLVTRVLANAAVGSTEAVVIRNVSQGSYSLDNAKLGDEEEPDATTGVEAMLVFPAGVNLAPNASYVVAQDGAAYQTHFGKLPDAEITNTSAAANTTNYANWFSGVPGTWALANAGDQVLLLDSSNTILDVFVYGAATFTGVTSKATTTAADQLYTRLPAGLHTQDTDDNNADFTIDPASSCPPSDTCIDLTVVKTNDVGGKSNAGGSWTWTLTIANAASAADAAVFPNGVAILTDDTPYSNIAYGAVGVTTAGGTTGNVNCAQSFSRLDCSASGTVSIPPGGSITVTLPANAQDELIYTNPLSGGVCRVDPSLAIAETNEANNDCSDSVDTRSADMIVIKSNNVNGTTSFATPNWTWTFALQNIGGLDKVFSGSTVVLVDNLPNATISYGTPNVLLNANVTGGPLSCSIDGASNLTCVATSDITFHPGGIATITVAVTALGGGTYTNPRPSGQCKVNSNLGTPADFNTIDDACGNTVVVTPAPTSITPGSSPNPSFAGEDVALTATVTSSTPGTITGTVTFSRYQGAVIGTAPLVNGTATFHTSSLPAGQIIIQADYNGDANFAPTFNNVSHDTSVSPFGAPPHFTATATSTANVALSWWPVENGASYEIYRMSMNAQFTPLDQTTATSYNDGAVSALTTYVYMVRAIGTNNAISPFSPPDAATTIVFTDPSLAGVPIKALHITELRTAVNAMRAAAGFGSFNFSDGALASSFLIRRVHVSELRTALDEARLQLGLPGLSYTDSALTTSTIVKAAHVTELRAGTQ